MARAVSSSSSLLAEKVGRAQAVAVAASGTKHGLKALVDASVVPVGRRWFQWAHISSYRRQHI